MEKEFRKHYLKYDFNDPAITRKYYHALRVMDLSILIAKYNNLNEEDIYIAKTIGLLHDYSRFEQWMKYKSYSDINVDHALLACKRLFDENEIANYKIDKKYYGIIYKAILNHNKFILPDMPLRELLFCKIIRDADKIDIFYLLSINQNLFKDDDKEINNNLITKFFQKQQIKKDEVTNLSEEVLLRLSMFYDINFTYSLEYIVKNNLLWKMFDNLKNKDKFIQYFNFIDEYIDRRKLC